MQAWKLQPTRGRAAKLRQVFEREGVLSCLSSKGEVVQRIWKVAGGSRSKHVERIHILHQIEDQVDIETMPGITRLVDKPVQELAITSLEREETGELPTINGQPCRMPETQVDQVQ